MKNKLFSLFQKKDFVVDVDVENTIYKLSFNKGENPWDVATRCVGEHNLPTEHIGQIVDYIIKNTGKHFINFSLNFINVYILSCLFSFLREESQP